MGTARASPVPTPEKQLQPCTDSSTEAMDTDKGQ